MCREPPDSLQLISSTPSTNDKNVGDYIQTCLYGFKGNDVINKAGGRLSNKAPLRGSVVSHHEQTELQTLNDETTGVWMDGLNPSSVLTEGIFLTVRQIQTLEESSAFIENYLAVGGQTTLEGPDAATLVSSLEVATKA